MLITVFRTVAGCPGGAYLTLVVFDLMGSSEQFVCFSITTDRYCGTVGGKFDMLDLAPLGVALPWPAFFINNSAFPIGVCGKEPILDLAFCLTLGVFFYRKIKHINLLNFVFTLLILKIILGSNLNEYLIRKMFSKFLLN